MRVLLISTNRELLPTPVPPLGLTWIAATLRDAGHRVGLCDLAFTGSPGAAASCAAVEVRRFRPDLIGLGIRNQDNAIALDPHTYGGEIRPIIAAVRASSACPIIAGGPALTVEPVPLLDATGLRYGMLGEGEEAFVEAAGRVEAGRSLEGVPGLIDREANPERLPAPARVRDLDRLPLPAHDLVDWPRYRRNGADAGVQTKRGCAFGCTYCTYPALEGTTYRLRDPERVADEVEMLARRHRMPFVFFVDSVFNTPPRQATAVCGALRRRAVGVRWNAYVNPRGMTHALARTFKESGCHGVELTADAADPVMLATLRKGFSVRQLRRAARALADVRIPYALFLLLGTDGETVATVRRSLDEVAGLPGARAVLLNVGARVYPGTPLARRLRAAGLTPPSAGPWYHIAPEIDVSVLRLIRSYAVRHPGWSTPDDWSHPHRRAALRLAHRLGIRPIWRLAPYYGLLRPLGAFLRRISARPGADPDGPAGPGAALPA